MIRVDRLLLSSFVLPGIWKPFHHFRMKEVPGLFKLSSSEECAVGHLLGQPTAIFMYGL